MLFISLQLQSEAKYSELRGDATVERSYVSDESLFIRSKDQNVDCSAPHDITKNSQYMRLVN